MEVIEGNRGKIVALFRENLSGVSSDTFSPQEGDQASILLFESGQGLKSQNTASVERRQRKNVMIAHTRSIMQNHSGSSHANFRDKIGGSSLRQLNSGPSLYIVTQITTTE